MGFICYLQNGCLILIIKDNLYKNLKNLMKNSILLCLLIDTNKINCVFVYDDFKLGSNNDYYYIKRSTVYSFVSTPLIVRYPRKDR